MPCIFPERNNHVAGTVGTAMTAAGDHPANRRGDLLDMPVGKNAYDPAHTLSPESSLRIFAAFAEKSPVSSAASVQGRKQSSIRLSRRPEINRPNRSRNLPVSSNATPEFGYRD